MFCLLLLAWGRSFGVRRGSRGSGFETSDTVYTVQYNIYMYIDIYIYGRRSFGVYLTLCLVCLFDYFNYFNYFVAPRIEIIKIIKIIKKIVWSSPRLFEIIEIIKKIKIIKRR